MTRIEARAVARRHQVVDALRGSFTTNSPLDETMAKTLLSTLSPNEPNALRPRPASEPGAVTRGLLRSDATMSANRFSVTDAVAGVGIFGLRESKEDDLTAQYEANMSLEEIVDLLDRHGRRATYGAVAAVLGHSPRSLLRGRERGRRFSWIVNRETGMPTGYSEELDGSPPQGERSRDRDQWGAANVAGESGLRHLPGSTRRVRDCRTG